MKRTSPSVADWNLSTALVHAKGFIGSVKPKHKFKAIRDAEEDVGRLDEYEKNCKILSRFVHPTAMSVTARLRVTVKMSPAHSSSISSGSYPHEEPEKVHAMGDVPQYR